MTQPAKEARAQDYAHCESLVRADDYDRWLAALFAPADKRPHLHALHAFSLEVARVGDVVSDPRLGEIRLNWWREALEGPRQEEALEHPVAAALLDTCARFRLPLAPLIALIEARAFDLWSDPVPDLAWLEGYCGETSSSLVRLATFVLADGADPGGAEAAGHAGLAWALAGLLRALPWRAARGRLFLPADLLARHGADPADYYARRATPALRAAFADLRARARLHLAQARANVSAAAPVAQPAFTALALVEPYLQLMERRDYDPFATPIDLPSWRKVAALWLEHRRLARRRRA